jgi:hypothetical protein
MPTTIFWPVDVRHSGFCYGWTTPCICVAGVLRAYSVSGCVMREVLAKFIFDVRESDKMQCNYSNFCLAHPNGNLLQGRAEASLS